mgnify:FL=1
MQDFAYQSKEEKEIFDEEIFDKILVSLSEISNLLYKETITYNSTQRVIFELKNNMGGNIHQIVLNTLSMAVALSLIVSVPLIQAHRIKKSKNDNSLVTEKTYTYQMDGLKQVESEEVLLKDAEDKKYIVLAEPNKNGYKNIITYDISDIDLPVVDNYFNLDLSKIENKTGTVDFSTGSEITDDDEESKKLIIKNIDYESIQPGKADIVEILLFIEYIFLMVIVEMEYSNEFSVPILTNGVIFLSDEIKKIKSKKYFKKTYDKELKEIINRINEMISQSEELSRRWNEEFEKNIYLMSDPSLLLSKYDELMKEIKENTMKLKM